MDNTPTLTHHLPTDLKVAINEFKERNEHFTLQESLTANLRYHQINIYNEVIINDKAKLYRWFIQHQNQLHLENIYNKIKTYFAFYQELINRIEASGSWIKPNQAGLTCIKTY